MDWVRGRHQKRKEAMIVALTFPLAGPKPRNPRKSEKRPAFIKRKPVFYLGGGCRSIRRTRYWHESAPFGFEKCVNIGDPRMVSLSLRIFRDSNVNLATRPPSWDGFNWPV
jgi:hypothetical protein